jgi:4-hydroxy-3-methylbut-2-en-1-yl diphosphate reductase
MMKILKAREAGFCFGVERAIDLVQAARDREPDRPIDILKEIVHNQHVIESFEAQDVRSVAGVEDARPGLFVISAHGVSPEVTVAARDRNLDVLDVTCPLVTRIHRIVEKLVNEGREVLLLGDAGHDEVEGILGVNPGHVHLIRTPDDVRALPDFEHVAMVSQTTQGNCDWDQMVPVLRKRFPDVELHNTICSATEQRQSAIREIARLCSLVYVVGSANSANAQRLVDIAIGLGAEAYLIENAEGLDSAKLHGVEAVGVSAGASTPDVLIQDVLDRLRNLGGHLEPLPDLEV